MQRVSRYKDVPSNAWYFDSVERVSDRGHMSGISHSQFAPSDDVTRAMVAQVIYNLEKKSSTILKNKFKDVKEGMWYSNAINWGADKKVLLGFLDNTFKPDKKITREELATMLYNYAKAKGYSLDNKQELSKFKDESKVSNYAKDPMKWAMGNGIISGIDNTTLSPKSYTTRAQLASILERFVDKFQI